MDSKECNCQIQKKKRKSHNSLFKTSGKDPKEAVSYRKSSEVFEGNEIQELPNELDCLSYKSGSGI